MIKKINYITNLPLTLNSGGWGGINYNLFQQLQLFFETLFIGPVNPPVLLREKFIAKTLDVFGDGGNFYFFSKNRLNKINNEVEQLISGSDYNFFYGQTPWINCNFNQPYGVYMDASFPTYLNIYLKNKKFNKKNIEFICEKEALWLSKAKHIFFGSNWAKEETIKYYRISENNMHTVWVGGNIDIPEQDFYEENTFFFYLFL